MDINKVQKLSNMAASLQKHHISIDKRDAIMNAEGIYGVENNFSKEDGEKMDTDIDEMRKDIRKIGFALQDAITELHSLRLEHTKLQRDVNDMLVGQKPRPQVQQAPSNPQFTYTPAPKVNVQPYGNQQQPFAQAVVSEQAYGNQQQPVVNQVSSSVQPQMASEAQARLLDQLNPDNASKSLRDPTKAIDRNNVAPNDVKIENFFNFGRK